MNMYFGRFLVFILLVLCPYSPASACILQAKVKIINIGNAPFPDVGVTIIETAEDRRAENVVNVAPMYKSNVSFGQVSPYYSSSSTNAVTKDVALVTHQGSTFGQYSGDHTAQFKVYRNSDLNQSYTGWTTANQTYFPTIKHINVNSDGEAELTSVKGIGTSLASLALSERNTLQFISYDDFTERVQSVEGGACLTGYTGQGSGNLVTTNKVTLKFHTTQDATPDCGHLPSTNAQLIYTQPQATSLGYSYCSFCQSQDNP